MKTQVKSRPARDHPGAAAAQRTDGGALQKRSGAKASASGAAQSLIYLADTAAFDSFCLDGYVRLSECPEIVTAVNTIAGLIGSMTIHLMENTERGDVRIRGPLSELVDIRPNRYMTRSALIQWIVKTLYLDGRGNAVVFPRTERGVVRELIPVPAAYVSFVPIGLWDYRIAICGEEFEPERLLHFTLNPGNIYPWLGEGFALSLQDVAGNLREASKTTRGFMRSEYKPSLVVKVDGIDGMNTKEGRGKILDDFVASRQAGEPWVIPAEQVDVKEVKPLTLSDLALADFVKLDKQTVASLLGVPPFVLGVGEYKKDWWNSFVSTGIMKDAQSIEQVLTRGLVTNPREFFRFNSRSLLNYSMEELIKAGAEMVDRMAMRRNEWRDWMGLPPDDEMDELLALENYIPADRLGDQKKLTGGEKT